MKLLTPNSNAGDGFIAIPQAALGSMSALYGNYNGILYNASDSTNIRYVQTTSTISSSTITLNTVMTTDFITSDGAETVNLVLGTVDSPLPGMITGTIQIGTSATSNIACLGSANVVASGKNILFCIAQNPNMPSAPVNLVLVSH